MSSPLRIHAQRAGFTLIEILMVIITIGLLASLIYTYAVPRYRERTYFTRASAELNTMANAVNLYVAKYNDYPDDVSRGIPPGLEEFLQSQQGSNQWPNAPWPGSVFDYDNWPPDSNGPQQTYQISIRFCAAGDTTVCKQNFPKESWVTSSWDSYSAVYYCLKGSCRSHQTKPMNHPGYCINCGNKSQFY